MPTWNQFAWSVLFFWAMSDRNQSYQELIGDDLLNTLRNNPAELNIEQIQANVIRRFLNAWRCRMEESFQAAEAIRNQLIQTHIYLQALNNFDLEFVDFDANIIVRGNQISISQACEEYYDALRNNIGYRFAATATSKILHLLQPNFFVMWDNNITAYYGGNNPQIRDSGSGYCAFLRSMQEMATNIREEFNQQDQVQGNDQPRFFHSNFIMNKHRASPSLSMNIIGSQLPGEFWCRHPGTHVRSAKVQPEIIMPPKPEQSARQLNPALVSAKAEP